jgi:hypothetical protein
MNYMKNRIREVPPLRFRETFVHLDRPSEELHRQHKNDKRVVKSHPITIFRTSSSKQIDECHHLERFIECDASGAEVGEMMQSIDTGCIRCSRSRYTDRGLTGLVARAKTGPWHRLPGFYVTELALV